MHARMRACTHTRSHALTHAQTHRRSAASNDRMRAIISTLSGAEDKKKSADGCADDGSDFGDDDDDWNVYRQISRDDGLH